MSEDNRLAPLPTERTKRIIQLAQEATEGAQLAQRQIRTSTDAAMKCGQLLAEERDLVIKACGRGKWVAYFESHFSHILPQATAYRWMKLFLTEKNAKTSAKELSEYQKPEKDGFLHSNTIRGFISGMQIMPKKEGIQVEGNQPTPRLDSHLAIINRFVAWQNNLHTPLGKLSEAELNQLRTDFTPISDFIHKLEAL